MKKCLECHYFEMPHNAPTAGREGKIGICRLFPQSQGRAENDPVCGIMKILIDILYHLEMLREKEDEV